MRFSTRLESSEAREGRKSPLFNTDELPENTLEKQKRVSGISEKQILFTSTNRLPAEPILWGIKLSEEPFFLHTPLWILFQACHEIMQPCIKLNSRWGQFKLCTVLASVTKLI